MKNLTTIVILLLSIFLSTIANAGETITFYHTDQAGTPIAISDQNGNKVWEADYKPFGEEYAITQNVENNRRFVGKEKDAETGLNYFGARYLSTSSGRFLAPDPVRAVDPYTGSVNMQILNNPQRHNSYAYSLNNPYRYVDPDGQVVVVVGSPSYKKQVNNDLSRIKSSDKQLKTMVVNLENSKYVHEIKMTAPGNGNSNLTTGIIANESNGIGTSSTTSYNPNNHYTYQGKRDPAVGLTHELTHASDIDQGIINDTINPTTNTPISEEHAMKMENIMRKNTGDPQRLKY